MSKTNLIAEAERLKLEKAIDEERRACGTAWACGDATKSDCETGPDPDSQHHMFDAENLQECNPAIGLPDPGLYPPDPWVGRTHHMRCHTCMWFVFKATANNRPMHLGRCRRHAPSPNGFVPVYGTDWCGDHRPDENRV